MSDIFLLLFFPLRFLNAFHTEGPPDAASTRGYFGISLWDRLFHEQKEEEKRTSQPQEPIKSEEVIAAYDELDCLREKYPETAAEINPNYGEKNIMEHLLDFYLSVKERFHIETQNDRKTYLIFCIRAGHFLFGDAQLFL